MKIWNPKKRDWKLNYTHSNPVKGGLVKHPGEWPWSGMTLRYWAWTKCYDGVDVPRGAYIPTKTAGTYAPPACESGVPVQDEPMAKMVRGMRAINAFTTDKANLPTAPK
ncbi:MAG: hypothetical protein WBO19_15895 [Terriglobia bacterium]